MTEVSNSNTPQGEPTLSDSNLNASLPEARFELERQLALANRELVRTLMRELASGDMPTYTADLEFCRKYISNLEPADIGNPSEEVFLGVKESAPALLSRCHAIVPKGKNLGFGLDLMMHSFNACLINQLAPSILVEKAVELDINISLGLLTRLASKLERRRFGSYKDDLKVCQNVVDQIEQKHFRWSFPEFAPDSIRTLYNAADSTKKDEMFNLIISSMTSVIERLDWRTQVGTNLLTTVCRTLEQYGLEKVGGGTRNGFRDLQRAFEPPGDGRTAFLDISLNPLKLFKGW